MTDLLSKVLLPLSLAIIMLGMGMTLIPADFTRIVKYPKAALVGLTNQLILLPIIAFILAIVFKLEPIMAIGLMAIAIAPGGATTNLVTQICRGNIALSVTLTAVCSFVSIITIPFILSYSLEYFTDQSGIVIKLPILQTILQIMVITVIPISIGMIIKKYKPEFSDKMEKPMRTASTVIFAVVFIAVLAANYNMLSVGLKTVGIVTLLLNLLTMGIGFLSAKAFSLDFKNAITITIESGIQNGTLSFVIVTTILNNMEMGIPIAVYSIWMFVSAGVLMWKLGRKESSLATA
ncbi:bile acid:Na+ symporter, BASS family [Spirosomataceae bacterium TFI 002]|nr:bile acid:Na+ symporter, BASS family [Spirosomataceae bacterium TFI 002]